MPESLSLSLVSPGVTTDEIITAVLSTVDARDSTKKTYRYGLRHVLQYCHDKPLTRQTLLEYKQLLSHDATLKTATKRLYLNSAKLLFRQLYHQGVIARDISTSVRGFRVAREHKADALSEQDVRRVFEYLQDENDARLTALFSLLYFQGLRRQEVVRLQIEEYRPQQQTLSIIGKGRDDLELVDLHPFTVLQLNAYLEQAHLRSGYLFPSSRSATGHLSEVQLHRLVQVVHQKLQLPFTVHAWRKAFTSVLIDSGMDLISVSKFTRHRSTQMLEVYYSRADKKKKLPVYRGAFSRSLELMSPDSEPNLG